MKIVLASASPRRRELLGTMGIRDFAVRPAPYEEKPDGALSPAETVETLALGKARACPADDDELVIAADTLVYLDGVPLGKPRDEADARRMLTALSGRRHQVYTGAAVRLGAREAVTHQGTDVFFRPLTAEEIDGYVAAGESLDKAGAYGIQGKGSLLVDRGGLLHRHGPLRVPAGPAADPVRGQAALITFTEDLLP